MFNLPSWDIDVANDVPFWHSRGLQSQPAEGLLTEAVLKHERIVPASSPTAFASVSVCTALPNGASGRLAARRGRIGHR
jgi:hypothetical protein